MDWFASLAMTFGLAAFCINDRSLGNSAAGIMTGKGPVARAKWLIRKTARTIGRMEAIQDARAMAGSPDAGFADTLA
jgi:hypothetical protein